MWLNDPFFIRNLTYGLEDSLISTTGLLVGITFAGMPLGYIIVAGLVLIVVEAMSMAFGSIISEESFMITSKTHYTSYQILFYALTMFISYFVAGLAVLLPYILRLPNHYMYSIGISIVSLFILVYAIQKNTVKALIMTCLGAVILGITILVGRYLERMKV